MHPKCANSMATSELVSRNDLVGIGRAISVLFGINGRAISVLFGINGVGNKHSHLRYSMQTTTDKP